MNSPQPIRPSRTSPLWSHAFIEGSLIEMIFSYRESDRSWSSPAGKGARGGADRQFVESARCLVDAAANQQRRGDRTDQRREFESIVAEVPAIAASLVDPGGHSWPHATASA
jgi:hypothetical protein